MNLVPSIAALMQTLRTAGQPSKNSQISETGAEAVISGAGRFAAELLAPLYRSGDVKGVTLANETVATFPGWPEACRKWCDAGWSTGNGP